MDTDLRLFYFVIQIMRFNEVKHALLVAIDEIQKTSCELKKDSEQYYFPDKEQVSWHVTHDVCVSM
jgi:hypothetical protein